MIELIVILVLLSVGFAVLVVKDREYLKSKFRYEYYCS